MIIQPITVFTKNHVYFRLCQSEVLYAPDIAEWISERIIRTECNPAAANLSEGMNNILIRFPEAVMNPINALPTEEAVSI